MSRSAKQPPITADDSNAPGVTPNPTEAPPPNGGTSAAAHKSALDAARDGQDGLLNTGEAAKFLGLSPHTLSKWRITGFGPPFHLLGRRCLYSPEVLRRWSASMIRKSTSDPGIGAEV